MRKSRVLFLILLTFMCISCAEDGSTGITLPPAQTGGGTTPGSGTSATAPKTITLVLNTPTVTFGGTVSITATVTDANNATVPDGTTVTFSVTGDTSLGSVTGQATTVSGVAKATFTAGDTNGGTATITVKAGDVINISAQITVIAPDTGSIEFVSASPQVIGVKGSGQVEVSTITFLVNDVNGNPVVDGTAVSFSMLGPSGGKLPSNGGEYIGDVNATESAQATTATGSTKDGFAKAILRSGAVTGSVTINASVTTDGTTFSSSSPTISIGGSVASAPHFSLAASPLNIPGLVFSGIESTITAFVADRFGNFNVLKGTSISFYTEAGAIDTSNVTDETGLTSVELRTQAPDPIDVLPGDLNPTDGWVTVLATVPGEEGFNDANGNGLFDLGEEVFDLSEPFLDKNNNGVREASAGESFEPFVDANGNGLFDDPNGLWDGPGCELAQPDSGCQNSKLVWDDIRLAFTGFIGTCTISPTTFTVGPSGRQSFIFTLGDVNNNILPAGTTIKVTATKGTLSDSDVTLGDGVGGPVEIGFSLGDPDTDGTIDSSSITVEVVPGEIQGASVAECATSVFGTVQ